MLVFISINKISAEDELCLVQSLLFSSIIPHTTHKSMLKMFMRSNANFLCTNFILKTNILEISQKTTTKSQSGDAYKNVYNKLVKLFP